MQKLICLQAYSSNQRQMPGELFSCPLTPVQIPGHSHCPIPSSEPSLLQPFASTESNNPQTEILREITLPMNFEGFIMEEHVCAWHFVGRGEEHKMAITWLMITHFLRDACTGWMSYQHFLSPLPHCPSAHVQTKEICT